MLLKTGRDLSQRFWEKMRLDNAFGKTSATGKMLIYAEVLKIAVERDVKPLKCDEQNSLSAFATAKLSCERFIFAPQPTSERTSDFCSSA